MLAELVAEYDFKQTVAAPKEDLLGIEQQMPTKGIIKLSNYIVNYLWTYNDTPH